MTVSSIKRKSDCLVTDPMPGDKVDKGADALEALARNVEALNERVKVIEEMIQRKQENQGVQGYDDDDISDDGEAVEEDGDKWTPMFNLLRDYRITNGHCKVREKDNKKLNNWTKNQKTAYTNTVGHKKGPNISPERIVMLESIGFDFGAKFKSPASWDEMYQELVAFKERMKHCNVPFNEKSPTPLAKWMAFQRKEYMHFKYGRQSLITLEQIAMMNDIGFKWKGPKLPN